MNRISQTVSVHGPISFHLLAVWAQRESTYVQAIWRGLDVYGAFLREKPSVVVGDFNSNARWDSDNRTLNHTKLADRLANGFGLVSSYHRYFGVAHGDEPDPTLYWQWKQEQPFHVDYCFVPAIWTIEAVAVGGYEEWQGKSDHRPLIVDLADHV